MGLTSVSPRMNVMRIQRNSHRLPQSPPFCVSAEYGGPQCTVCVHHCCRIRGYRHHPITNLRKQAAPHVRGRPELKAVRSSYLIPELTDSSNSVMENSDKALCSTDLPPLAWYGPLALATHLRMKVSQLSLLDLLRGHMRLINSSSHLRTYLTIERDHVQPEHP